MRGLATVDTADMVLDLVLKSDRNYQIYFPTQVHNFNYKDPM